MKQKNRWKLPRTWKEWKKLLKDDRGWTFVETLIVIAIALMLSAMVGLAAFKQVGKAKQVKAQTEISNAALALGTYYLDCGFYPSEQQGLAALYQKPSSDPVPENWMGPYLTKNMEQDPWGREYVYQVPGPDGLPFGILSYGSDGQEGGEGEAQDIHSW